MSALKVGFYVNLNWKTTLYIFMLIIISTLIVYSAPEDDRVRLKRVVRIISVISGNK